MVQVARKGLALYNIELPDQNKEKAVKDAYEKQVAMVLGVVKTSSDVEGLMNLPFCTDETVLSAMKLYVLYVVL